MKTIKVRIAVAVSSDGAWAAHGWGTNSGPGSGGEDMKGIAAEMLDEHISDAFYWVEAEVPLPEPPREQEILGRVVEDGK